MDEAALIRAAKRGDVTAFNRLVLDYQGQVYNLAYRVMGDGPAAEDATQEAFISAYRHLPRFRGGSFKAWLLRIATNACYDELRRRKRRPASSLDDITEHNPAAANEANLRMAARSIAPEDAAERDELAGAIQRCLNKLGEDQRMAVVLCDVQGYDYDTIARLMSTALGTVKSRIARARARLRDCLREDYPELLPARLRLEGTRK